MTRQVGTAFDNLNGLLRRFPLTSSAFLVAYFSLGGLPLLAGFPTRQVLMESIAQHSLGIALWAFIGNLGFLLSGFRVLAVLVKDTQSPWQLGEEWPEMIFLAGGIVALLLIGIFPHFFLSGTLNLLNAFERLQ
jgi:formate hydrogenlyase subunit 3/multisubunit Na+/H+ antiporter MnhD subunit